MKRSFRKIKRSSADKRLKLFLALIFLFGAGLGCRLVLLQFWHHDYYAAMAASQHLVSKELRPDRGQILTWERTEGGNSYYPMALNKDLALVYVVPYEIKDAPGTAEIFYALFDEERVHAAVNKMLDTDGFFRALQTGELSPDEQKERSEFREIKFELEVKNRKEAIISAYLSKLEKKFDPYEPIKSKVEDGLLAQLLEFDLPGVYHVMEKHRYYPDKEIGAHLVGFVGYSDNELHGRYGLEGFFDHELSGEKGLIRAERSAGRGDLMINGQEYSQPVNGSDLYLSINRSIQYYACQRLALGAEKYGAESGTVLIMDPNTGAIIAMCSYPSYDPSNYNEVKDIAIYNNPSIFDAYEPGSIFKSITVAAGLDREVISPQTEYVDQGQIMIQGWPKPIRNSDYATSGGHGRVNMVTVLALSLNTGAIFIQEKTGAKTFADYVKNFGFGEKTGIELQAEGVSNIASLERNVIRPVEAATASFGQGITATPIQLTAAFGAIANGGILMKPYLVERIARPDGSELITSPRQIRRVIQEKTAYILTGMMVNVVESGHANLAAVKGYYVAGKTGTAQISDQRQGGYLSGETMHSFVGFAPAEEPRFVMLVKLDKPKNARYAASSAAPLFSEIAEFILSYYQTPKER